MSVVSDVSATDVLVVVGGGAIAHGDGDKNVFSRDTNRLYAVPCDTDASISHVDTTLPVERTANSPNDASGV